ncbi:hypothetical protein P152DRAFT_455797 [Eremomyces bilateralis CBS 781.70]|uniref:Endoplasmic reticulum junction formation protein lunapark n=1 Tax=Eremomyces bilateralis CBS 781.70 TaxID=1392243 RepID=A0A6G1GAA7_9PEZI|nr:uncharacterized protein P152DRAFT_455797 [Eremomyces bilateralis CBS 781.70]KAF1814769.1 hypothetical protein P152DRAFT_455797 [Eremomyces bilateralis CBS 781.70]
MVSFWPFKAGEKSAASFEKELAELAKKISATTARQERLRQQARRARVSTVLYGGFAYTLAALILILVTGWRNWGPGEYQVVCGGPVMLFGLTWTVSYIFNYRISTTADQLEKLNHERETTIEMLKKVTNYNSTKQLLDKYSGEKPKPGPSQPKQPQQTPPKHGRTRMPPPRTANIQRPQEVPAYVGTPPPPASPSDQLRRGPPPGDPRMPTPTSLEQQQLPIGEEFAPNAFNVQQYTTTPRVFTEPRWYDRILDALLGEDETQAKNRLALICQTCRLVNGQAPPGVRRLEDVGRWRCHGCGASNGVENEATAILRDMGESVVKEEARAKSADDEVGVRSSAEDTPSSDHGEEYIGEHLLLGDGPAEDAEPSGTGRERPPNARKRSNKKKGSGKQ